MLISLKASDNPTAFAGSFINLGIDTEVMLQQNGETLYPHLYGCPQARTTEGHWFGYEYDWHGDGYAWELCTKPEHCIDMILHHLIYGLRNLTYKLPRLDDLEFSAPTVYEVPALIAQAAPEEVTKLGCARSFNVYAADEAIPGKLGRTIRTTGCHLHISHDNITPEMVEPLIKWADILVGNTWTMLTPEAPEAERLRRTAYGRAGEFRQNMLQHRVEYRVLPGRALLHPASITLMLALYRQALWMVFRHGEPPEANVAKAREAINNCDKELATQLYKTLPVAPYTRRYINFYRRFGFPILQPLKWEGNVGFKVFYQQQQWLRRYQ